MPHLFSRSTGRFFSVSSFQILAMFRRGMFYAYLSIYLRYFLHLSVTETTLFATLPMLANIIFQSTLWGRLSDRYQLRRTLIFWGEILGLPALGNNVYACGQSQVQLVAGTATVDPVQRARGYRYLTIQVFDVKKTHAQVLAGGGREGSAPVKLGDVAHISFVRDPDGNWLEISQRKSITGSLD